MSISVLKDMFVERPVQLCNIKSKKEVKVDDVYNTEVVNYMSVCNNCRMNTISLASVFSSTEHTRAT